jgi:hypothetical protein
MLVLAMEFSRGTTDGAGSASSVGTVARGRLRAGVTCFSEGGHFTPSKRNRGSPGAWLDPYLEVRASRRQSPTTGKDEEGAKPVINWEFLSRM